MNGILNVLKPPGMTSFDVVAYLRGVLRTRKIGHTGTLDPGAVGVLPVCVGNATKVIEYITEKDKLYRAELTLGIITDTQDSTGEVLETRSVNVDEQRIKEAIMSFVGEYSQIPPMYSAVKVNGQRLYDLARSGITVERQPRQVRIDSISIISIDDKKKVLFDVVCSKGTYIRTLCSDIGERLGCGGHMSFLIRLKSGIFDMDSAVTLEDITEEANKNNIEKSFIKVSEVFRELDSIVLERADEKKFLNGVSVRLADLDKQEAQAVRVFNDSGVFIAIGEILYDKGSFLLRSKKLFTV